MSKPCRLRIGTSGYSYKEWKGNFYPQKLPASRMLDFYAQQFGTVEINSTFYRMPKRDTLTAWTKQVPNDFLFVLKAPQRITHSKRLKEAGELVDYFFTTRTALAAHAGPTLFQLPPFLRKDVPRLTDFLAALPQGTAAAFEFRHASWHDDAVYAALHAHNAALCLADVDTEGGDDASTPRIATADWGYVRLRRADYAPKDLAHWFDWLAAQAWRDAFVFLKHEDAGRGPALAQALMQHAELKTSPVNS